MNSLSFVKLFGGILESTVWAEPHATRIVWVAMLAMADRNGRVWASVPGLANRARVTIEECEAALGRFKEPDRYSRTPDHEGRRITDIEGGWQLLNYAKYRAMRDHDARLEYQREWDRTHRGRSRRNPTSSDKSDTARPGPTQAEAEAEVDKNRPRSPQAGAAAKSLTYPGKLADGQRSAVDTIVRKLDRVGAQLVLDELEGAMRYGRRTVADPLALLKNFAKQQADGAFVPSHAHRIQAEREGEQVAREVAATRGRQGIAA